MRIVDLWSISEGTFISRRDFEEVVADILESYGRWNVRDMRRLMQWIMVIAEAKDSVWAILDLMRSALEARTRMISEEELFRRANQALRGYNEAVEREQAMYGAELDRFEGFDEFDDGVDPEEVERHARELEALEQMDEDDEWMVQSTDDNDERDMDF